MIETHRNIYTEDFYKQDDGRYTLVYVYYNEKFEKFRVTQKNLGMAFNAERHRDTGNDSGCCHFMLEFEVLDNLSNNQPKVEKIS